MDFEELNCDFLRDGVVGFPQFLIEIPHGNQLLNNLIMWGHSPSECLPIQLD